MTPSDVILGHFDKLAEHGLMPIPLKINSKQPYGREWNKNWNRENSRYYFRAEPTLNMGLLLGDVVDVEGDTPEANDKINKLIGDYPHPCYRSRKSYHHLFLTPDPKLRRVQVNGIEFRGHGHQSVVPPSQHQGIFYRWVSEFWPIPPMPQELVDFYWSLQGKKKPIIIKPGHMRTWCGDCREQCFIHQKRFNSELELFKMMGEKWTCQKCRKVDMRPLVRRLRRGTLKALRRKAG